MSERKIGRELCEQKLGENTNRKNKNLERIKIEGMEIGKELLNKWKLGGKGHGFFGP